MNKQERAERLNEMRRFYFEKDWTLEQIANYYKVTRQAIHDKFVRAGVKLKRRSRKVAITLERETLLQLYEKERLSIGKVANYLKVSYPVIVRELKRHNIKISRGVMRRKSPQLYEQLNKLEIGEQLKVERPSVKQPHSGLYYSARAAGIRITVKSIDRKTLLLTRIE